MRHCLCIPHLPRVLERHATLLPVVGVVANIARCARALSTRAQRVVVGMSGGVDSSVSAYLLKQQGYEVHGVYMKNWDEYEETGKCSGEKDQRDAEHVCKQLNIPFHTVSFIKEYWHNVFEKMLADYANGLTPNPDVLCNREIKFKMLTKFVFDELKADFLATGHYARTRLVGSGPQVELLRGVDPHKDQSYFLAFVKEQALRRVLFPLGGMHKTDVRTIAHEQQLCTAAKRDSTGLCFVGKRKFSDFLSNYLDAPKGLIRTITGLLLPQQHKGLCYYTIGQSASISHGPHRWIVVDKRIDKNELIVAPGTHHPALYTDSLIAYELSWVAAIAPQELCTDGGVLNCQATPRYRKHAEECVVSVLKRNAIGVPIMLEVRFARPQRAITPHQVVVFYKGDVCLGGGLIMRAGRSYFEQNMEVPPEAIKMQGDIAHSS